MKRSVIQGLRYRISRYSIRATLLNIDTFPYAAPSIGGFGGNSPLAR
jgi:hypothetical protein